MSVTLLLLGWCYFNLEISSSSSSANVRPFPFSLMHTFKCDLIVCCEFSTVGDVDDT